MLYGICKVISAVSTIQMVPFSSDTVYLFLGTGLTVVSTGLAVVSIEDGLAVVSDTEIVAVSVSSVTGRVVEPLISRTENITICYIAGEKFCLLTVPICLHKCLSLPEH